MPWANLEPEQVWMEYHQDTTERNWTNQSSTYEKNMQFLLPRSQAKTAFTRVPKKGHNICDPKLRGIGIGPGISRIYDVEQKILQVVHTKCRTSWVPRKAGMHTANFVTYLPIDLSVIEGKDLFIISMDYEKAFDFVNRALLLEKMMKRGIGQSYATSVYQMFRHTSYLQHYQTAPQVQKLWGNTRQNIISQLLFTLRIGPGGEYYTFPKPGDQRKNVRCPTDRWYSSSRSRRSEELTRKTPSDLGLFIYPSTWATRSSYFVTFYSRSISCWQQDDNKGLRKSWI